VKDKFQLEYVGPSGQATSPRRAAELCSNFLQDVPLPATAICRRHERTDQPGGFRGILPRRLRRAGLDCGLSAHHSHTLCVAATAPGDLLAVLPKSAPENGEGLPCIYEDFLHIVDKYSTHCNHPRYFGYFSSSAAPPAILADLLASSVNANLMLWRTGSAATEIEERVAEWLREWLGLPDTWRGISYEGGSISTLHALAAARHRVVPEAAEQGGSLRSWPRRPVRKSPAQKMGPILRATSRFSPALSSCQGRSKRHSRHWRIRLNSKWLTLVATSKSPTLLRTKDSLDEG